MKKTLDDVNLTNKVVLARFDLNVPFNPDGTISDFNRIKKVLPTIKEIVKSAKLLVIISHLGRIKKEADKKKLTLWPVYNAFKRILAEDNINVSFEAATDFEHVKTRIHNIHEAGVLFLENTRYYDVQNDIQVNWESKCNDKLAHFYASLADVFVNDAFGTGHRKHASNYGVAKHSKEAVVGRLVEKELTALEPILINPKRPFLAILGGAKVSDKIGILSTFLEKADQVLIGGGMSYTFIASQGKKIGTSIFEKDRVELANELLHKYANKIILPVDYVGTNEFSNDSDKHYFVDEIPDGMMGLDIGKNSIKQFINVIAKAKTILWNGPMGVFEFPKYAIGTMAIAKAVGKTDGYVVIGGGDSVAAVNQLDLNEYRFNHVSTGGGALLTILEGKELIGFKPIPEQSNEK